MFARGFRNYVAIVCIRKSVVPGVHVGSQVNTRSYSRPASSPPAVGSSSSSETLDVGRSDSLVGDAKLYDRRFAHVCILLNHFDDRFYPEKVETESCL